MFKKEDIIVYGTYGLCAVEDIRNMSFSKIQMSENYYVLKPLKNANSTYYVPVNNEKAVSKLRLPMTKEQIENMLCSAFEKEYEWKENRQLRDDFFNSVLEKGVSAELVSLINCIYMRKETLAQKGKNISATDKNIFSVAEKMLNEELSYVLGTEEEKVSEYIKDFLLNKK